MKALKILGIETSCDETAAAVFQSGKTPLAGKILSNAVASQIKTHARTGGVVPEVAARMHVEKIVPVIQLALKQACISLKEIDALAVTAGPGLITSLRVGVDTARALALVLKIPIVAINHIEAHVFSPFLNPPLPLFGKEGARTKHVPSLLQREGQGELFPALSLVVSGGHTELILVRNWLDYKKIGQTLDDASGEAFDKIAKLLGLPYPGGPALAKIAERGNAATIAFPRPMLASGDYNFSFSGLKTAVLYYILNHKLPAKSYQLKANIAASAQAAIVEVLVKKTFDAAQKYKVKAVLVGGGVAANQLLKTTLTEQAKKAGLKILIAKPGLSGDNAAMIAFCGGLWALKNKFTPLKKVKADAGWELD
jgi:N6-L-threonylcarbamoyladenine synthase